MLLLLSLLGCINPPDVKEEPLSTALLIHEENPRRKLWLFEHTKDGFVRREPHIARDISSLGAVVMNNELLITGTCWWPGCGSEREMKKRNQKGPAIFGISTTDLKTWVPRQWRLLDEKGLTPIDPQLSSGTDGLELWYFGAAGQDNVDPMNRDRHEIRRATLHPDGRFHSQETVLNEPGLADPSPIRFRGKDWIFATQYAAESIVAYTGTPLQLSHRFKGISVPHALEVNGELWLLATEVNDGRQQPVRAISKDGKSFSDFEPFLPLGPEQICASPVGAVLNGKLVVLCVEEPLSR